MLDNFSFPAPQHADVQWFKTAGSFTWRKRPGISMVYMLVHGGAGGGGNGAVGAAGSAAGGGGGGSAGQSVLQIPAFLLPDVLYVQVGAGGASVTAGGATKVMAIQGAVTFEVYMLANGGFAGNSASGATAGAFASGASNAAIGSYHFGGLGVALTLGGNSGQGGGTTGAGTSIAGLNGGTYLSGGAGGGGVPAAGNGGNGGDVSPNATLIFPSIIGGAGSGTVTVPGLPGASGRGGMRFKIPMNFGGSGGGASMSAAVGAGLFGGNGGDGGQGSGGGGGGGCITTGVAGVGGRGGDGQVLIIGW